MPRIVLPNVFIREKGVRIGGKQQDRQTRREHWNNRLTVSILVALTTTLTSSTTTTVTVEGTSPLPTNSVTTFSSTGIYTIPATTITVTESTTVCAPTTTPVPSGTHTVGGVTTIVETSTVITCPYATVSPSGTTVTSVIEITTYTCPAAGTYTIGPITTTVETSTILVYPTPTTLTPGTYTKPEQTVTVTDTSSVYVCPFATNTPSTSSSLPPPPASTSSASPEPSSTSSATQPASTGSVGYSGNRYGITLDPYTPEGQCADASTIASQVAAAAAKGFQVMRVYSTDCNCLETVGGAVAANGMKIVLGVYIGSSDLTDAQSQVEEIVAWGTTGGNFDIVDCIITGNEAINSGYLSASQLAAFVASAASAFRGAGYTGPIGPSETVNVWQAYGSTLCGVIDLLIANIHAYFNSETTPATAGTFVQTEMELLAQICPGKKVLNAETGWPTAGEANGIAVPSPENQAVALANVAEAVGGDSIFFSYANEPWKAPGPFGVERYWGCFDVFN